jgi:primase-polymerase (primpol)-like protein
MTDLVKKFGTERQWTNWRYEVVGGKKTKVPYFSKTKRSSSTDPSTWKTYDEAETALDNGSNKFDGVGIFFKDDLLLLGVDIDHCIEDGKYVHPQLELIEKFLDRSNTYTEISPSRTGLHLFFKLTEPYTLTANKKAPFEIYNRARFLTVTNQNISSLKEVRTVTPKEMDEILSEIGYPWTKKEKALPGKSALTDEQILTKMFNSKIGAKLKALYNGDTSEYDNDKSSADYGLCSTLAFWSGRDEAQIERLWLASPLGQREKTKERKDYRSKTVTKAVANCSKVYETTAMRIEKENPQIEFLCSFNKDGEAIVVQNTENICRVSAAYFGITLTLPDASVMTLSKMCIRYIQRSLMNGDNLRTAILLVCKHPFLFYSLHFIRWGRRWFMMRSSRCVRKIQWTQLLIISRLFNGMVRRVLIPGLEVFMVSLIMYITVLSAPTGSKVW